MFEDTFHCEIECVDLVWTRDCSLSYDARNVEGSNDVIVRTSTKFYSDDCELCYYSPSNITSLLPRPMAIKSPDILLIEGGGGS